MCHLTPDLVVLHTKVLIFSDSIILIAPKLQHHLPLQRGYGSKASKQLRVK